MLNQDYKEMLLILIKNNVDFMVIGAYALAHYGFPRSTGDIDIFVNPNIRNSILVHRSLVEFGAPVSNIPEHYFAHPGNYFQIGVAPCRIDILNEIDGIVFSDTKKSLAKIDGIEFSVIDKGDFIKNKLASGRPKDIADVSYLKENRPTR